MIRKPYSAKRELQHVINAYQHGIISREQRDKLQDDINPILIREQLQHHHSPPMPSHCHGIAIA